LQRYILALVRQTRALAEGQGSPPALSFGASPRATLALVQAARALAFLRGGDYTTPGLVQEIFVDATRHRIGLTYEAEAQQVTADQILQQVLKTTPVPEKA
jgi:MoxR-like ATPase